jgi:hypothetical protein
MKEISKWITATIIAITLPIWILPVLLILFVQNIKEELLD